ncbi:MAG: GNAT family N-acetyltransferase [Granulosicoccaceae bacterium]
MIFREANTSDLGRLLEMEQGVVEAERPFNAQIKEAGVKYYDFEQLIESEDSLLLVVELDGDLIAAGYAQIRVSKPSVVHHEHVYLGFMYVSPEHRRKGLNQRVLERLLDWGKGRGVMDVYLDVYAQNEAAIQAYKKAGFAPSMLEMKLRL